MELNDTDLQYLIACIATVKTEDIRTGARLTKVSLPAGDDYDVFSHGTRLLSDMLNEAETRGLI